MLRRIRPDTGPFLNKRPISSSIQHLVPQFAVRSRGGGLGEVQRDKNENSVFEIGCYALRSRFDTADSRQPLDRDRYRSYGSRRGARTR